MSERHAQVVGELESRLAGWNEIETRLQHDVTARFQGLERLIEHEWASLRRLHEEPTRQLREHAESLTEICVSTAGSAQTGLERAEARLATLEKDLHRKMDDLSRDLQAVLAELRQQGPANLRSPAGAWSLDEVARLHQELRDGVANGQSRPAARGGSALEGSPSLALRVASPVVQPDAGGSGATLVEPPDADRGAGERATGGRSVLKWYAAVAVLVTAVGIASGLAWSFYGRARLAAEHAFEARQRAELIATTANERIDAAGRDAAAQVALAREAAARAQMTGDILTSPDLVRFNLLGGDIAARASAQLLWSRSRGLVFSSSRMPPLPPDAVYHIWLLTAGDAVSAGTVMPDASGRATLATDSPPDVPRPIVGVRVTLESAPGSAMPSGATVLSRAAQ